MPSLLSDFLRGDPERQPDAFRPPESAFAPPSGIRKTPALAWRPGMIFLGVIDGDMKADDKGRPYVTRRRCGRPR